MTRIYDQWVDRVAAERIRHSHVIQLYSAVYPMHRGFMVRGKATNLTKPEASDIITRLAMRVDVDGGIRAEADNEERGRQWLAANERARHLPKLAWADIDAFRLVGFHVYSEREYTGWGTREVIAQVSPIWRCEWASSHETFDYSPTAWQAGTTAEFWWKHRVSV